MKKSVKRLIAMLLTLVCVCNFAACTSKSNRTTGANQSATSGTPNKPDSTTANDSTPSTGNIDPTSGVTDPTSGKNDPTNGKTDPTDPKGEHSHDYKAVVTEPTCTESGYTTYTCDCGDSYVADETAATGHTEQLLAGVAATCTEAGLTKGKKCSVCGEIIIAQTVIPATGHIEETIEGRPATCTESGLTVGAKCLSRVTSSTVVQGHHPQVTALQ